VSLQSRGLERTIGHSRPLLRRARIFRAAAKANDKKQFQSSRKRQGPLARTERRREVRARPADDSWRACNVALQPTKMLVKALPCELKRFTPDRDQRVGFRGLTVELRWLDVHAGQRAHHFKWTEFLRANVH